MGWVKLKLYGGYAVSPWVDVEVVTVLPLVLVDQTPLLGVTVWPMTGLAGQARGKNARPDRDSRSPVKLDSTKFENISS